jgi:hypothetical protein
MLRVCANWVAIAVIVLSSCLPGQADDQPQWGQHDTRNMVSQETRLPDSFVKVLSRASLSGYAIGLEA